jgi:hypothetical protein
MHPVSSEPNTHVARGLVIPSSAQAIRSLYPCLAPNIVRNRYLDQKAVEWQSTCVQMDNRLEAHKGTRLCRVDDGDAYLIQTTPLSFAPAPERSSAR